MRDAVISVYESRKNLALTLKDTRSVVGKLETILGVGIHGVCFLFYLSIFGVSMHHTAYLQQSFAACSPLPTCTQAST